MAHWIIEDKGFGGCVFTCSNCKDSWNDIHHSGVGQWDKCPSCHEKMDHDKDEYVDEKKALDKLKELLDKISESSTKASVNIGNFANIYEQIARNTKMYNDKRNQIDKLEFISGMSIEQLIELFAAGWVLKPPMIAEFVIPGVTDEHYDAFKEHIDAMVRAGYFNAGEPVIRETLIAPRGSKKTMVLGELLGNSTEDE